MCTKHKPYRTRYYTVNVPRDAEEDPARRETLAWLLISDNPRIAWHTPSLWWTVWDEGDFMRIAVRSIL